MSDYSRGDYADLPAGTTDLENNYTAPDLTAIASNDNSTYAEQTANNEYAIHQYKKTVTGAYTNITWSGKSSLAPSESPVVLEVYNVTGTPAWEELDRDDSTAADTDFDLIYNNLAVADYLDSGVITWRVYQAASAGEVTKYIGLGTHSGLACDYSGFLDAFTYYDADAGNNYGSDVNLNILSGSSVNKQVSFIRIPDLAKIVGTVSAATLNINVTTQPGTLYMRRVLLPWDAGFGTGTPGGGVTWSNRMYGGYGWNTAGGLAVGDFFNSTYDVSSTTTLSQAISDTGLISLTSEQLIADINDMITNPGTNYGWQLYILSSASENIVFDSSQATTEANRPYLEITGTITEVTPNYPEDAIVFLNTPTSFNGTSDSITVDAGLITGMSGQFSIAAWFSAYKYQTNDNSPDWNNLVIIDAKDNTYSDLHSLYLYTPAGNYSAVFNWDGTIAAGNRAGINSTTAFPGLEVPAIIVCTYDQENFRLYHNGIEDAASPVARTFAAYTPTIIKIGKFADASLSGYFKGIISRVLWFNRALTPTEVANLR